jgi:hypothetical protein
MRRDYFGIRYEYKSEVYTFYPDYIVEFSDGKIGIFETKDQEDRDEDTYTKVKNEALQKYIEKENKKCKSQKLLGGIVFLKNNTWIIRDNKDSDLSSKI